MNLRRQRARVLALGFLVLTPAAALGSTPTAITALPDAAFEPVTAASLGVPDGPSATNAQPSSIASAKPYVRPTPAPSPSRPAPPPQTVHATSTAHPANGRSTAGSSSNRQVRRGVASYYCCTARFGDGLYAAAGPQLRVGSWRGRQVTVTFGSRTVRVRLIDWCQCRYKTAGEKLIDLEPGVLRALGLDPSRGVWTVTVSW